MRNLDPLSDADRAQRIRNAVWTKLSELQTHKADRYIVFEPVPCGLGGQLHGRVLTLALAVILDRKALFLTLEDQPYGQTLEPVHELDIYVPNTQDIPAVDILTSQSDPYVKYDPSLVDIEGFDLNEYGLVAAEASIGVPVESWDEIEGAVFDWLRPIGSTLKFCENEQRRLKIDSETLGVHFRRGDKTVESAFVPAKVINAEIEELCRHFHFTKVFLASDSPDAVREIEVPDGIELIFDREEKRYNNANHKMLHHNPDLINQETRSAFKNIFLLSRCGGIVGQNNAHFATLAACVIKSRTGQTDRCAIVDGHVAEKRSTWVYLWFRSKRFFRHWVKELLPQLTFRSKMNQSTKSRTRGSL